MEASQTRQFVNRIWDEEIIPQLKDYIAIPNRSPLFDPDWATNGYMEQAVNLMCAWARQKLKALPDATLEVVRLPDRTPLIYMDIPGKVDETVVLYGHLDKQPDMTGWDDGLGPNNPVLRGDKLYGRGGADDGYAMFASITSILALHAQDIPHARCVILIEACEESGSYDLPHYVSHLADKIGSPSLVVCLDSGCANYDQLWLTTSLRGMLTGALTVEVLREGVHSGDASGVVPDSFRLLRRILSRLEDEHSGAIKLDALQVTVPSQRMQQAQQCADILGDAVYTKFPFIDGMLPSTDDPVELILNRTWRPQLTVTGMDGFPAIQDAGNVLRPRTACKISLRLPPTLDAEQAAEIVSDALCAEPPYGAKVTVKWDEPGPGWHAPPLESWLANAVDEASATYFGQPCAYMGEGGSIPFMGMLGAKFPSAQFLITGVLGPHSNAHGPNEFLHIPTGKRLTMVVAHVLAEHAENAS